MELNAVTSTYMALGLVMVVILLAIYFTPMPYAKEEDKKLDFKGTYKRLKKNRNYVWGVIAQFFYVGAQIAVWSFIIIMNSLIFSRYQIHLLKCTDSNRF